MIDIEELLDGGVSPEEAVQTISKDNDISVQEARAFVEATMQYLDSRDAGRF